MSEERKYSIGIPCKYSETSIIPKFIWDYVEDDIVSICRGGEKVLLELVKEYNEVQDANELDLECKELFKVDFATYAEIWGKRVISDINGKWVKVKMHKV